MVDLIEVADRDRFSNKFFSKQELQDNHFRLSSFPVYDEPLLRIGKRSLPSFQLAASTRRSIVEAIAYQEEVVTLKVSSAFTFLMSRETIPWIRQWIQARLDILTGLNFAGK